GARLLIAAATDALGLKVQSRVLAVDRPQDLPLRQGFGKLVTLFERVRPVDDRIDEITLVAHGAQGALEMRLAGEALHGCGEDADPLLEIGRGFDAAVHFGNTGGKLLAALFLDIELERLEQRLAGMTSELGGADLERRIEVAVHEEAAGAIVVVLDGV